MFNGMVSPFERPYGFVLSELTADDQWVAFPQTRLYSFLLCELRRDIELAGGSRLYVHPLTSLVMRKSRIVVEDGTLRLGILNRYSAEGYDTARDNCRVHLYNSVLRTVGDVKIYPGCRIFAIDGTLVVRNGSIIQAPTCILVRKKVEIGERCRLARNVTIMDSDWHGLAVGNEKPRETIEEVTVKDHCWIGQNAMILKGVTIGEGAVVGAGSVVTRDIEPRTMVAGNPARVIRQNVAWE